MYEGSCQSHDNDAIGGSSFAGPAVPGNVAGCTGDPWAGECGNANHNVGAQGAPSGNRGFGGPGDGCKSFGNVVICFFVIRRPWGLWGGKYGPPTGGAIAGPGVSGEVQGEGGVALLQVPPPGSEAPAERFGPCIKELISSALRGHKRLRCRRANRPRPPGGGAAATVQGEETPVFWAAAPRDKGPRLGD